MQYLSEFPSGLELLERLLYCARCGRSQTRKATLASQRANSRRAGPDPERVQASRTGTWRPRGSLVLAAKFFVTAMCLWYLARKINFAEITHAARDLEVRWVVLAVAALVIQLPLVAVRWSKIVDALDRGGEPIHRLPLLAITAIASFFAQLMPNVASEGIRVWMLTGQGIGWQRALVSVLIDRGVGVGGVLVVALAALLVSPSIAVSAAIRGSIIQALAAVLAVGVVALALAPYFVGILEGWRYTAWVGKLARAAHDVLLKTPAGASIVGLTVVVQFLVIASVWLIGRGLGLSLTIGDAGVLFTVIFASILLPISIAGWGVRELAITAVLGGAGVPVEQSLLFSVAFGLAQLAASLPGAVIWTVYAPGRLQATAKQK